MKYLGGYGGSSGGGGGGSSGGGGSYGKNQNVKYFTQASN